VLNILDKNFIRSKIDYGATDYGNAPKRYIRVVGGFYRTTPIYVLSAANTIPSPEQRRTE
jgi:hypothetical protein